MISHCISWSALGVRSAPDHLAVRLINPETLANQLGGTLDPRVGLGLGDRPKPFGLFDEHIFGPLSRWPTVSESGRHPRSQMTRFGCLVLPFPVIHPFAHRMTRAEDPLLGRLARGELVLTPNFELIEEDGEAARLRGGRAALALANAGKLQLDAAEILEVLPILPAGLRPAFRQENGAFSVHDISMLYEMVMTYVLRYARLLELGAPSLILAQEARLMQQAVDALFFDGIVQRQGEGEHRYWSPAEKSETPTIRGILGRMHWTGTDSTLSNSNASLPPFSYQACLHALALELVFLDEQGNIDDARNRRRENNKAAHLFDEVYEERLGPLFEQVLHARENLDPHIDVYATEPQKDGTRWIVTAGMSMRAMPDDPKYGSCTAPRAELVFRVSAEIEESRLLHIMHAVQQLAYFPFLAQTFLAVGHDVVLGRPIAPGSYFDGYVFVEPMEMEPLFLLSKILPHRPQYLLAIATSPGQRAELIQRGRSKEAFAALLRETKGISMVS